MTLQYSPDSYASALGNIRTYLDSAEQAMALAQDAARQLAQTGWDDLPRVAELADRLRMHTETARAAQSDLLREAMALRTDANGQAQWPCLVAGRDFKPAGEAMRAVLASLSNNGPEVA